MPADPDAYLFDFDPDAHNERLREQGDPETWADNERDRMIDALGYGPPPGM